MSGVSAGRRPRRRRIGRTTSADRLRQETLHPIGVARILTYIVTPVIGAALIGLIWINTNRAIRDQADDTQARAEAMVQGQANTLADAVHRDLAVVDQSLSILQAAWDSDEAHFDLKTWKARMPALMSVSKDIFIANDKRVIVQDILPQAVGQGVGAAYADFAKGTLQRISPGAADSEKDRTILGALGGNGVTRQHIMYLVRGLHSPRGWLVGASFRSKAVARLFVAGALGPRGIAALIDGRHGGVQAEAGPAARARQVVIANTPLFHAMMHHDGPGIWVGRTPMDGVQRILAFQRVPGRDIYVLTGVDRDDWMAWARQWATTARAVATTASLMVLALGGIVTWEVTTLDDNRRRRRTLARVSEQLTATREGLAAARARNETGTAQLQAMMESCSDGVAAFDADWCLRSWNPLLAISCGMPQERLQRGLPLEELLRFQAEAGTLGAVTDARAAVEQRMARLREAPDPTQLIDLGADRENRTTRVRGLPDGGLLLVVAGTPAGPTLDEAAVQR